MKKLFEGIFHMVKMPKQLNLILIVLLGVVLNSCDTPKLHSPQGLSKKHAFKLLSKAATENGLTLIENKYMFSSDGNRTLANSLVVEPENANFEDGVPVSVLLFDNFSMLAFGNVTIKPGIYVLKYQVPNFKREIGRYPAKMIFHGIENKYSIDYELEVVSLGGAEETPDDYLISTGFGKISPDKQYKLVSIDFRKHVLACNCCVKPPPEGVCNWGEYPRDPDCPFAAKLPEN